MAGTPHAERLLRELAETRAELSAEIAKVKPDDLGWAPKEGMKTYGAILQEIGTMEKLCIRWVTETQLLDWTAEDKALAAAPDPASLMKLLDEIRTETVQYLQSVSEDTLEMPIDVHPDWHQYMGPRLEPEEFVRWISRHEYYHLGQIVSYLWIQGNDPYKQT
jgi:uncharacterized damage-inducible protein DinB